MAEIISRRSRPQSDKKKKIELKRIGVPTTLAETNTRLAVEKGNSFDIRVSAGELPEVEEGGGDVVRGDVTHDRVQRGRGDVRAGDGGA